LLAQFGEHTPMAAIKVKAAAATSDARALEFTRWQLG
jgi:hypothetical protein